MGLFKPFWTKKVSEKEFNKKKSSLNDLSEDELKKIFIETPSAKIKKYVISLINDDEFLEKYALTCSIFGIKEEALLKINNPDILMKYIRKNKPNCYIGGVILKKLMESSEHEKVVELANMFLSTPKEHGLSELIDFAEAVDDKKVLLDIALGRTAGYYSNYLDKKLQIRALNSLVRNIDNLEDNEINLIALKWIKEISPQEFEKILPRISNSSFFKEFLDHKDPNIRLKVIPEITDLETLRKLALCDESDNVKMAAIEQINDENVLKEIAFNGLGKCSVFATSKINDISILCDVVDNVHNYEAMRVAFNKITDENDLFELLVKSKQSHLKKEVVERMTDMSLLKKATYCLSDDEFIKIKIYEKLIIGGDLNAVHSLALYLEPESQCQVFAVISLHNAYKELKKKGNGQDICAAIKSYNKVYSEHTDIGNRSDSCHDDLAGLHLDVL